VSAMKLNLLVTHIIALTNRIDVMAASTVGMAWMKKTAHLQV